MRNFHGEIAHLEVGPSMGEQPVGGIDQFFTNMLPFFKKETKACELDEARQVGVKVGREAPKLG